MKLDAGGALESVSEATGAWGLSSEIFASVDNSGVEPFGLGFGVFNRDRELVASVFQMQSSNLTGCCGGRISSVAGVGMSKTPVQLTIAPSA